MYQGLGGASLEDEIGLSGSVMPRKGRFSSQS
jgi:hypothetical protein